MQRMILRGYRSGSKLCGQRKKVTRRNQKTTNLMRIFSDVAQDVSQESSDDSDLEEPREEQKKEVAKRRCCKTEGLTIPAMLDDSFSDELPSTGSSRAEMYLVVGIFMCVVLVSELIVRKM